MDGQEKRMIRLLEACEIECRVSTVNDRGVSLLLFKDARVDQKILDETFSPFGWKRTHQSIDGNLYCTVEIWDEGKQQWIGKQDVGTTSYAEKEKGQASDSFKRACFNWGIGRELYTAPFIWIPASRTDIQRKENRYTVNDHFTVSAITYNERREITGLTIINREKHIVFETGKKEDFVPTSDQKRPDSKLTKQQLSELHREMERTGVSLETVLNRYQINDLSQMDQTTYLKAVTGLKKTRAKIAA